MSFFGTPQSNRNQQRTVRSADIETIDLLTNILKELKKLNIHMTLLTEEDIENDYTRS